jgi:hypothetical protein
MVYSFKSAGVRLCQSQSGIALLQVLLFTLMISLVALSIATGARNNVDVAGRFLDRLRAEMKITSALNVSIMQSLVRGPELASGGSNRKDSNTEAGPGWDYDAVLAQFDADVNVVDLGGLLPQAFPRHPLWRLFLSAQGYSEAEVNRIIGEMADLQDTDRVGWNKSFEPDFTPTGLPYPNRPLTSQYALMSLMEHVDRLGLLIEEYSHPYSQYTVSLINSPGAIVRSAYGGMVGGNLKGLNARARNAASSYLNASLTSDHVSMLPSPLQRYSISVVAGEIVYSRQIDIELSSLSSPPFSILGQQDFGAERKEN